MPIAVRRPPSAAAVLLALGLAGCAAPPPPSPGWPVPPVVPRERVVDVLHYDIAVDVDHEAGFVDGRVTVRFASLPGRPADRVRLDAVELEIRAVWDEQGEALGFEHADGVLDIALSGPLAAGETGEVTVEYDGFPRRGLLFIAPSAQEGGRPWHVWSQGQAEDTRHWIPVHDRTDDLATHQIAITVDDEFVTMAAGELVATRDGPHGRRTDTWRQDVPHVSYLITMVAGGYAVGAVDGGDVPLPVLAERGDLDLALANLAEQPAMLECFARLTGMPYPYAKYANACVKEFTAGGMENVSATTLFYGVIHDPDDEPQVDALALLAHETAHQWFGDLLTCASWDHLWLNEGFADFMENRFLGERGGRDVAALQRLRTQRSGVQAELRDSRPIVWDGWDHPDDAFDGHAYSAGAARLHLLAAILGDDAFWSGVRLYLQRHRGAPVVTSDLRAALEQASGRDLGRFFEQWLHGPGVPRFRVTLQPRDPRAPDGDAVLVVEQVQGDPGWPEAFELPVTVVASRDGVERTLPLAVDERVERLDLGGPADWARFDGDTRAPMVLEMIQPEPAWRGQLREADDGVARLLAAEWFSLGRWARRRVPDGWRPEPASLDALQQAAADDPFPPVRVAALAALDHWKDADLPRLLERLVEDDDAEVREAAVDALGRHGDDSVLPLVFDALEDRNASVVAAALQALVERESPAAWTELRRAWEASDPVRWRLDRAIVDLAARLDDERTLPFLMAAVRTHPESAVRARAARRLGGWTGPHEEVVHRMLCELLHDPAYTVRAAAAGALGGRGEVRALEHLRARRAIEIDPSVLGALDGAQQTLLAAPTAGS